MKINNFNPERYKLWENYQKFNSQGNSYIIEFQFPNDNFIRSLVLKEKDERNAIEQACCDACFFTKYKPEDIEVISINILDD